ncbi:flippase [bacterium]|nr:flippase [bacterium]
MKEHKYNIVNNLFYSSISVLTTFFLFILMTFMGRYLGSEKYGMFMLALHIATIFEMFTDFGLRDISVRNVAQQKNLTEKYIGNLLIWKILLSFFVMLALIGVVHLLGYDSNTQLVVYILAPSAFLKSLKYTMRIFLQVHNRFAWDTVLVFIERFCLLGIGLAVLFQYRAVFPLAICFTAVRLVDFLLILVILRWKIIPFRLNLDFHFMKKLQLEAFPLGLFFVVLTIYSYIDTVMLSLMRSIGDVGMYNSAFKIYEGVTILPTIFWLVLLPRLSELFTENIDHHKRLAIRSIKYMFVIGIPISIYGIILSHYFLGFFYGDEYLPAVLVLKILFIGIVFQFANWMLNATLISMNRQKIILLLGSAGLAFKIIMNLILIKYYGYYGSSVTTVLGELLIFAIAFYYLFKHFKGMPIHTIILKPILAGGFAYFVYYVLLLSHIPFAVVLFCLGLIYILSLFTLKTFDDHELKIFFQNTILKRNGLT